MGFSNMSTLWRSSENYARVDIRDREFAVTIFYEGEPLTVARLDMVVDNKVVVEYKLTAVLPAFAQRQVFNYLRASSLKVGLILHFGPVARFYRLVRSRVDPR